jgi:hypothetical protein
MMGWLVMKPGSEKGFIGGPGGRGGAALRVGGGAIGWVRRGTRATATGAFEGDGNGGDLEEEPELLRSMGSMSKLRSLTRSTGAEIGKADDLTDSTH